MDDVDGLLIRTWMAGNTACAKWPVVVAKIAVGKIQTWLDKQGTLRNRGAVDIAVGSAVEALKTLMRLGANYAQSHGAEDLPLQDIEYAVQRTQAALQNLVAMAPPKAVLVQP